MYVQNIQYRPLWQVVITLQYCYMYAVSCNDTFILLYHAVTSIPHYSAVKCHYYLQPTPYSYMLHIAPSTDLLHHLPPAVILMESTVKQPPFEGLRGVSYRQYIYYTAT